MIKDDINIAIVYSLCTSEFTFYIKHAKYSVVPNSSFFYPCKTNFRSCINPPLSILFKCLTVKVVSSTLSRDNFDASMQSFLTRILSPMSCRYMKFCLSYQHAIFPDKYTVPNVMQIHEILSLLPVCNLS